MLKSQISIQYGMKKLLYSVRKKFFFIIDIARIEIDFSITNHKVFYKRQPCFCWGKPKILNWQTKQNEIRIYLSLDKPVSLYVHQFVPGAGW